MYYGLMNSSNRLHLSMVAVVLLSGCGATQTASHDAGGQLEPGVVETTLGAVQGQLDGATYSFKGIPYAAPPIGELRWRPPQRPEPWGQLRSAAEYGSPCTQVDPPTNAVIGEEDCLTLNVWTPAESRSNLPVMVWIHGGDNILGWSGQEDADRGPFYYSYNGRNIVERSGVVLVTVNYRVGAFGFLAHPEFANESAEGATGNYGLLDLIESLRWVRANAGAFGGDSENITVFGQSAGASNVCALIASPLARGLFQRAILQSLACHVVPPPVVRATNEAAEAALGCEDSADITACLRAADVRDVARVPGASIQASGGGVDYYLTLDSWSLPDFPRRAIELGKGAHVPVLLGTTSEEYSQIIELTIQEPVDTPEDYEQVLRRMFGDHRNPGRLASGLGVAVLEHYPPEDYPSPRWALVAAVSDQYMHCPTRQAARALAAGSDQPVWRYVFSHGHGDGPLARYGAAHSFEIPFVFGNFVDWEPTEPERRLSKNIIDYWTRFSASGDPNGAGATAWPRYESGTERFLVLDVNASGSTGWRSSQCDFWDAVEPPG